MQQLSCHAQSPLTRHLLHHHKVQPEQDEADLPPLAGEDSDPDPKDAIKTSIKLREAVPAAASAQGLDPLAAIQVVAPHLETRQTSQSVKTAATDPEDPTQECSRSMPASDGPV